MNDLETLLKAVKNQRWYFFENNHRIIFDSSTALLWVNLKFFPYRKDKYGDYSYVNSYGEVRALLKNINAQHWGGFGDWKVPTPEELWHLVEDKTFPYQEGENWLIKGLGYWCVYNNGFTRKDMYRYGAFEALDRESYVSVILCSHALVPKNFSVVPQEILNIFLANDLIPRFNDENINWLYAEYKSKTKIKPQLQAEPEALDYQQILEKYDVEKIDRTPTLYREAVQSLTDRLANFWQRYETSQKEIIAELLQVVSKLNSRYVDDPNLNAEENNLLLERQKFLTWQFGLKDVRALILSAKSQTMSLGARNGKILRTNGLFPSALSVQPESFEALVKRLVNVLRLSQRNVEFFAANKNFVKAVIKTWTEWNTNYRFFKTNLQKEFETACRFQGVDEKTCDEQYEAWRKKRFEIEKSFLQVVKFALKNNSLSAQKFFDIINTYRNDKEKIDNYYLNQLNNPYVQRNNFF